MIRFFSRWMRFFFFLCVLQFPAPDWARTAPPEPDPEDADFTPVVFPRTRWWKNSVSSAEPWEWRP
jgi:hypothetical protein